MSGAPDSSKAICKAWLTEQCPKQGQPSQSNQQCCAGPAPAQPSTQPTEQEMLYRLRMANLYLGRPLKEEDVMKLTGLPTVDSWEVYPAPKGAKAVAGPRGHICWVYDDEVPDPPKPALAQPAEAAEARQLERLSFVSRTLLKPEQRLTEAQLKEKVDRSK
eukprot:g15928.t1